MKDETEIMKERKEIELRERRLKEEGNYGRVDESREGRNSREQAIESERADTSTRIVIVHLSHCP